MSDELRARLGRIDPARDLPLVDGTSPTLDDLLEDIMTTTPLTTDEPTEPGETQRRPSRSGPRRRIALAVAGVAACTALAVGLAVSLDDGGSDSEPLALTIAAEDALASCIAISPELVAQMPVAFAATAVAIDGEAVTLDVDRWYAGETAAEEVVVTQASETSMALIGGVEFVEGGAYLITATDGVVNACGFSGEATPELTAIFDAAFGA